MRSTQAVGVSLGLLAANTYTATLLGAVVRSDFPSGRSPRPRGLGEGRGLAASALSFCPYSPECVEGAFCKGQKQDSAKPRPDRPRTAAVGTQASGSFLLFALAP